MPDPFTHTSHAGAGPILASPSLAQPSGSPMGLAVNSIEAGDQVDATQPVRFQIQHQQAFATLWNSMTRMYRSLADDSQKDSPENSRKMLLDLNIRGLFAERIYPSTSLKMQVTSDDPKDPTQKAMCEKYDRILTATPRLGPMKRYLSLSAFYGKYGAQLALDRKMISGQSQVVLADHMPWSGDKINFDWDGIPAVMVRSNYERPDARFRWSDRGGGKFLMLDNRYWRDLWAIQQHDPIDRDFLYEADLAGQVHGEGLRGLIYFPWLILENLKAWELNAIQRIGVNGMIYGFADASNPNDEEQVFKALADLVLNNIAVFKTQGGVPTDGIKSIPPSPVLRDAIEATRQFFLSQIRLMVVGQTLSSDTGATGMGSGVAELHRTTKEHIVRADAARLGETYSTDVLPVLMRANGDGNLPYQLKITMLLDREDRDETLNAAKVAQEIGLMLDEEQLRDETGFKRPSSPENTLKPLAAQVAMPGMPEKSADADPETPGHQALKIARTEANYAAYEVDEVDPGVMIALFPTEELADRLAVPGGNEPDDLHVTLAYLGKVSEVGKANLPKVERAVKLAAMRAQPLAGSIGGVGRFPASVSSDGMGVLYAGVDVPGLVELRQEILANLHGYGIDWKNNHGFTPHMTLDYVEPDAPLDLKALESAPAIFRAVYLCYGEERIRIPLGMHARRTKDRTGRLRGAAIAQYAAEHAPHSMTVDGKEYRGGEFIPGGGRSGGAEKAKDGHRSLAGQPFLPATIPATADHDRRIGYKLKPTTHHKELPNGGQAWDVGNTSITLIHDKDHAEPYRVLVWDQVNPQTKLRFDLLDDALEYARQEVADAEDHEQRHAGSGVVLVPAGVDAHKVLTQSDAVAALKGGVVPRGFESTAKELTLSPDNHRRLKKWHEARSKRSASTE